MNVHSQTVYLVELFFYQSCRLQKSWCTGIISPQLYDYDKGVHNDQKRTLNVAHRQTIPNANKLVPVSDPDCTSLSDCQMDSLSQLCVLPGSFTSQYVPKCRSSHYYYATNLQGDVVAILDSNGTAVVKYTYDAWGKVFEPTGSMASTLGIHNPLRYRGFVYDTETGLYYLQSRYYDPEMGRFINADIFVSTGQGVLGYNMFSYCLNNPVNYVDRSGNNAEAVQWWTSTMWWLCGADTVLPVGDIIYGAGILVLGVYALTVADEVTMPQISLEEEKASLHEVREHTKGARPSTKGKHQKGQTRKKRDNGGEKGDARRYYRGNKKKLPMFFFIVGDLVYEDESTQVVTSGGATSSGFGGGGGAHSICAVHMLN